MPPNRPTIPVPIQMQAFRRRPRRWQRWCWALAAALVTGLLIWFMVRSPDNSDAQPAVPGSAAQVLGPPWRLGSPEARFTVIFYADLECPHCKSYSPQLQQWIDAHPDVSLQWHHLPLSIHEPAAGHEARLVECTGRAGGHDAFWTAVQWVYANTRSDGQGVPNLEAFPSMSEELQSCMSGEESARIVQAQAAEATASGIAATPSLRLVDRTSGTSLMLSGPVPGDSLLSAIDMLAVTDPTETRSPDAAAADAESGAPR